MSSHKVLMVKGKGIVTTDIEANGHHCNPSCEWLDLYDEHEACCDLYDRYLDGPKENPRRTSFCVRAVVLYSKIGE